MPKHVDKLRTLLAQLDCKFSFIGIYWHMRLEILLSWFMNTVSLDTINSPLLLSLLQEEYLCMSQTLFLECLGMISIILVIWQVTLNTLSLKLTC